jgi:hypothetical protein
MYLDEKEEAKRPTFLLVLAIFSFIAIGFGILGSVFGFISGPASAEEVESLFADNMPMIDQLRDLGSDFWADQMLKAIQMVQYTNANFWLNQTIVLITYVVGLMGVIWMLQGMKRGFHAYIIYNLLALFGSFVSVPFGEYPTFILIFNSILSGLFIFLYSRNLSYINK